MWGSHGQRLMSTSEPWFSFWVREKLNWPVLDVLRIGGIVFWHCLCFSYDCGRWDWLRWRDQHHDRRWIQPHLAHYLPSRVRDGFAHFRTAVGCRAEGIWGFLGHLQVHTKLVGKSRVLMPQSRAWLHKTTSGTREQCYILKPAMCDLFNCSQD